MDPKCFPYHDDFFILLLLMTLNPLLLLVLVFMANIIYIPNLYIYIFQDFQMTRTHPHQAFS
jgi:uncharacterized membrane protein